MEYKPRVVDGILRRKLQGIGAVLIEGPKLCGKTTTGEQFAKTVLRMGASAEMKQNLTIAEINPNALLLGETPRLIDEWQLAPTLWDAVREEVDKRGEPGQFILTGSAVPADRSSIFHTGTGRFAWIRMRPMSLFESGESNGSVSLKALFDGDLNILGKNDLTIDDIAFMTCRGGWPTAVKQTGDIALDRAIEYYQAIVNADASRVDGIRREPERVKLLMRSYARNQGGQVSLSALKADMLANDTDSMADKTVQSYINALKQIFVIEDMPSWNPNLRSKVAIRTTDTRYFSDPSIATAALGFGPQQLLIDPVMFGFMFETLCMRDLRVYADALDGAVYHFRDKSNLECDAVLYRRDGTYGLIEIKLGGDSLIDHGARTLKELAEKIDTDKMEKPAFLMVLTAVGSYAYRRKDGVLVVPIGTLQP